MKEMDPVEVIVEKEEYAEYGIHKGMHGWICQDEKIHGSWLVNFPQCAEHEDIETIGINEKDLKVVPVMYAIINERLRNLHEGKTPKTVKLNLTGCKSPNDICERITKAFHFPEWYKINSDISWSTIWNICDADKVIITGTASLPDSLSHTLSILLKTFEDNIKFCNDHNLTPFSYEITS